MSLLLTMNESKNIVIPKDSIRFRVIANSDLKEDQELKLEVKSEVEKELYSLLTDAKNVNEARKIISNNIDEVDNILKKYGVDYNISYGNNYFPIKEYKGVTYDEGNYESLVITLGSGLGQNWWCVLFPPLCLLDEKEDLSNYDYEFYSKILLERFNK